MQIKDLVKCQNNLVNKNDNNKMQIDRYSVRPIIYKQLFDYCYAQVRSESYDNWISVGMALKNSLNDINTAFVLFDYFSSKGRNYEGSEKTEMILTKLRLWGVPIHCGQPADDLLPASCS